MNNHDEIEPDIEGLIDDCNEPALPPGEFGRRLDHLLYVARQKFPMEPVDD